MMGNGANEMNLFLLRINLTGPSFIVNKFGVLQQKKASTLTVVLHKLSIQLWKIFDSVHTPWSEIDCSSFEFDCGKWLPMETEIKKIQNYLFH